MSFSRSLFLVLTLHARIILSTSCETHISPLDACAAVISFSGNCYSMTVNLNTTEYVKFIETPSTDKYQAYNISLNNEELSGAISNVYRIINEKETEITTHDKTLVQQSDENYQVIFKFQGPTHLSRYGVNIDYEIV